jgi:tetratricopeptide (TPR) repeat protein
MSGRVRYALYAVLVILFPAAFAAGLWFFRPGRETAAAERAAAGGDWSRAEALLRRPVRQEEAGPDAVLLYVQALRHLKRVDEGETFLLRAFGPNPSDGRVRRELALLRAARRFTPAVEHHLEECLREKPDDVEVILALAGGYAGGGRWDEADRCYTRALELQPDRLEVRLQRGHLRLTAAGEHLVGRVADAAADFEEVLRHDGSNYEARLYLAHCLVSDARMPEAKVHLLRCREQRPDRVEPLVGLAACALEEPDWDEADRLLRAAGALEPGSTYVLIMRGDLAMRRGRFEEASTLFRRVTALEPRNKAARLKLAQSLRQSNRSAEAEEQMRVYQGLDDEGRLLPSQRPR